MNAYLKLLLSGRLIQQSSRRKNRLLQDDYRVSTA